MVESCTWHHVSVLRDWVKVSPVGFTGSFDISTAHALVQQGILVGRCRPLGCQKVVTKHDDVHKCQAAYACQADIGASSCGLACQREQSYCADSLSVQRLGQPHLHSAGQGAGSLGRQPPSVLRSPSLCPQRIRGILQPLCHVLVCQPSHSAAAISFACLRRALAAIAAIFDRCGCQNALLSAAQCVGECMWELCQASKRMSDVPRSGKSFKDVNNTD